MDDYGEDSDFVRVRVRGEFPRAGSMQFISGDLVAAARKRLPECNLRDPCVLAADIARFGDDQSVIVFRRGLDAKSVPWVTMRGADTMQVAARIADMYERHKPDAVFVDEGGVGGGVVDRLRMLKIPVMGVQFGANADRHGGDERYYNKRSEIWGQMRLWLRHGAIPDMPDLESDLTGVEFSYKPKDGFDCVILEKKADMKKRGLASPDLADALAISFAYPVFPSDHSNQFQKTSSSQHRSDYAPLGVNYIKNYLSGRK